MTVPSSFSTAIARFVPGGRGSSCAAIVEQDRLLPAQSALGRALYVHYGLDPQQYETNILIADGLAWFKSEGSIRMAEGLGFPWSLAALFRIVPLGLRDPLYDWWPATGFASSDGPTPVIVPNQAVKIDSWHDRRATEGPHHWRFHLLHG